MSDRTPSRLQAVNTPALVLDRERLHSNLDAMASRAADRGVSLRPHMKTAKSAAIGQQALDRGAKGITVSTLHEAEYFFSHGFEDITYAVSIVPDRFLQASSLARRGLDLKIITDNPSVTQDLAHFMSRENSPLTLLVEIDSGEHRTGVDPQGDDLVKIARLVDQCPSLRFGGLLTHAGHSYKCSDPSEIVTTAEDERRIAVESARRLTQENIACSEISIGSTPTCTNAQSAKGVTEWRPGVYMFGDLAQVALTSCTLDDIALSVLTTILAVRPEEGRLIIDGGGLAMSKDMGKDVGYGLVNTLDGTATIPGLHLAEVHQEHGELRSNGQVDFSRFSVGDKLRILPHHACMTAAMHDRYHVVEGNRPEIVEVWDRANGWG
ncbi:MAG: alanine racemase [Planctomycetota bacterium]|nr:alanine racemase [Planctomycetota bacterium]